MKRNITTNIQPELFAKHDVTPAINAGAEFSECGLYRYKLWRIWDESLPLVMYIGLNPSTANETSNDNTITKLCKISRHNGYGGFYMMNCYTYIATKPEKLIIDLDTNNKNNWLLKMIYESHCKDVVFAWGNFPIVVQNGRDKEMIAMFPKALCLKINKNGSPKHPLYCKDDSVLIPYTPKHNLIK